LRSVRDEGARHLNETTTQLEEAEPAPPWLRDFLEHVPAREGASSFLREAAAVLIRRLVTLPLTLRKSAHI
jgi:hypothetical protein